MASYLKGGILRHSLLQGGGETAQVCTICCPLGAHHPLASSRHPNELGIVVGAISFILKLFLKNFALNEELHRKYMWSISLYSSPSFLPLMVASHKTSVYSFLNRDITSNTPLVVQLQTSSPKTLFLFQDCIQDTTLYLVVLAPEPPPICSSFSKFPGFS